jgi:hypothetical protein
MIEVCNLFVLIALYFLLTLQALNDVGGDKEIVIL